MYLESNLNAIDEIVTNTKRVQRLYKFLIKKDQLKALVKISIVYDEIWEITVPTNKTLDTYKYTLHSIPSTYFILYIYLYLARYL